MGDIALHGAQAARFLGYMADPLAPILAFPSLKKTTQPAVGIAGLFPLWGRALLPEVQCSRPLAIADSLIQRFALLLA